MSLITPNWAHRCLKFRFRSEDFWDSNIHNDSLNNTSSLLRLPEPTGLTGFEDCALMVFIKRMTQAVILHSLEKSLWSSQFMAFSMPISGVFVTRNEADSSRSRAACNFISFTHSGGGWIITDTSSFSPTSSLLEIHVGPFHQRVLLTRDKGFTPLYARSVRFFHTWNMSPYISRQ